MDKLFKQLLAELAFEQQKLEWMGKGINLLYERLRQHSETIRETEAAEGDNQPFAETTQSEP